eukprot:scaffold16220_cov51-Attheya_sp.AAC.11
MPRLCVFCLSRRRLTVLSRGSQLFRSLRCVGAELSHRLSISDLFIIFYDAESWIFWGSWLKFIIPGVPGAYTKYAKW